MPAAVRARVDDAAARRAPAHRQTGCVAGGREADRGEVGNLVLLHHQKFGRDGEPGRFVAVQRRSGRYVARDHCGDGKRQGPTPCRSRKHKTLLKGCGGSTGVAREQRAVASWLCVPGFRRVCLCRAPLGGGVRSCRKWKRPPGNSKASRVAGGRADMATPWSPKSPSSASPPFGGFALSSGAACQSTSRASMQTFLLGGSDLPHGAAG